MLPPPRIREHCLYMSLYLYINNINFYVSINTYLHDGIDNPNPFLLLVVECTLRRFSSFYFKNSLF